jgi:hypothetical protein
MTASIQRKCRKLHQQGRHDEALKIRDEQAKKKMEEKERAKK